MTAEDRARWDNIYRRRAKEPYPTPDPLLFEFTPPVPEEEEHTALDLAGGQGQNGLWLTTQGYVVDIMDISRVALQRGRDEMLARKLRNLNFIQIDLDTLKLERNAYDLVCVFRYLRRDSLAQIRACIRPDGRVIYQTFNISYLDLVPQFNPDFLLQPNELRSYFVDWNIIHYTEESHITQLVALKPD